MKARDNPGTEDLEIRVSRFNPLKIVIPVLLALLTVSLMAQWYASNVSFPRYCRQPEVTLQVLQDLVGEDAVIDNDQRRQYMVAAKILFLHPKNIDESQSDYMLRLRRLMLVECQ